MNATQLFETVTNQLATAAEIIGGRPWGADKGKPRIYMPSSCRGRKVFFEFPDFPTGDPADQLGGAALKIFIDDCGQHANWYTSQRQKVVHRMYRPSLALSAIHAGDAGLAAEIMDRDDDITAEEIDAAGGHLINGRIAEARETLGL